MKKSISVRLNEQTIELIANFCQENDIIISDWFKLAIIRELKRLKLL